MARRKNRMFGQPAAGDTNPIWGVAASGAIGTSTAVGVRKFAPQLKKHSELLGMGAGVAAGVLMMMSKKMRAAGFVGVVTALVNNGLRYVEAQAMPENVGLSGFGAITADRRQLAGNLGIVTSQTVPTLGAASAQTVPTLGAASAQTVPTLGQGPVTFQGQGQGPVTFQGLAQAYGATIYG